MKVYVTQGHEKGIGLEVFFKTCLVLSENELKNVQLLAYKDSVEATLETLKLPFKITESNIDLAGTAIPVTWIDGKNISESFTSLELGMRLSESGGVLYTLPTSKDQFPGFPGHTEYFRAFYKKSDLGMFFSSPKLQVLLLSDHVAINRLSDIMTEELIYQRLKNAISTLKSWSWPTKRILISGFNPHAGEQGLIGNEDQRITAAINRLRSELKLDMSGPLPGDTMLLEQKSREDLLVYVFHDQGLGVFKGLQGFIGSNITLGLPYPRFSPDHGTSFSLYGKNVADYRGCAYSLREALHMLKKVSYGKDSGHQSKSSQSKKY
jgi:4-hydroxythreonine-4-phosphate dehydrogenase